MISRLACACALLLSACAAPRYLARTAPRHVPPPPVPGVVHAEGTFTAYDGVRLFEQSWRPAGEPKAALVVMHGLKDHSSRYGALAERLAAGGYAVHAFDLRGHGYSEGRRVWIDSFDQYLFDLELFVKRVREAEPNRPLFLFGHSMGGAIVTLFTLTRKPELRGLVLSGAALKVTSDVSPFLVRATKWLSRHDPRLAVLKLPNKNFSRDPRALAAMERDPAIYQGAGPARTAAEVLGAIERIQKNMESLAVPLLVLHGAADRVTNPDGSRELYRRARSTDKRLELYEGFFHDLLHEPDGARVAADLAAWLDARAAPAAPAP
jgi:acylglycerol lipase